MKKTLISHPASSFVWLVCLFPLWIPAATAQTFRITNPDEQTVRFFANHTLGEVDGTLHPVTGTLTFNPGGPTSGLSGHFTADMTSFDTGLGLRDKDMRNKYLETEQYPEATFTLHDALPTLLDDGTGDTLHLVVAGSMTLHGTTRDHPVTATLAPTPDGYRIHAVFSLLLSDYGIPPPKRFMLTVQDEIRVELDLTLVQQP